MSCVIKSDDTKIVFKKGVNGASGYWLVDGKYKVADLSECKILGSAADRALVVQAVDARPAAAPPPPPPAASAELAHAPTPTGAVMEMTDVSEAQNIMALAGDSVWGGIAIFALVMIFRFLNKKMELDAQAQTNSSQQCATRHAEASGKAEDVAKSVAEIEKRVASVELELRYMHDPRDRPEQRRPPNAHPRG
jgi:hypothetical protein